MGNLLSGASADTHITEKEACAVDTMKNESDSSRSIPNSEENMINDNDDDENIDDDHEDRRKNREDEMTEFTKQLDIKREQRREILARHRAEKEELDNSLHRERDINLELAQNNRALRDLLALNNIEIPENLNIKKEYLEFSDAIISLRKELDKFKSYNITLRQDLTESIRALQRANSDIVDLKAQNTECVKQISALKDVISISKTMINLREQQLNELKNKLTEIEQSLAERETNILSADLRKEYERQLQNIRTLRGLYEERARLAEVTRKNLIAELDEQKKISQVERNKSNELTERVNNLEEKVTNLENDIEQKNSELFEVKHENNALKAETSTVNMLFSQVLLGYKTKHDLDKLICRLEENHGILTHMAEKESDSDVSSALPKLLLELVNQVDGEHENVNINENTTDSMENEQYNIMNDKVGNTHTTAEEIVQNLPKVWKVLTELLSQQTVPDSNTEKITSCYKSVNTKSGSILVPSVSQTYIRLKDLIVEKLALVREVNRMKQLNSHLESRLEEQEQRLSLVTTELSKTWHVVGRLRRHHYQLHTHEKILKYELQQKRKLLNELKEELEYCREKWLQAREKNSQSEKDWKILRAEFSSRKTKLNSPLNNSGESGYSDERPSDDSSISNDETDNISQPLVRCKKKIKKSYEIAIDSSTDFNPAAETEDPASDMLDIAELPLDTQDVDDNYGIPVPCASEMKCRQINVVRDETNEDSSVMSDDTDLVENEISCHNDNIIYKCPQNKELNSSMISSVEPQVSDKKTTLESNDTKICMLAEQDKTLETLETTKEKLINKINDNNANSSDTKSISDLILMENINQDTVIDQITKKTAEETLISVELNMPISEHEVIQNTEDNKNSKTTVSIRQRVSSDTTDIQADLHVKETELLTQNDEKNMDKMNKLIPPRIIPAELNSYSNDFNQPSCSRKLTQKEEQLLNDNNKQQQSLNISMEYHINPKSILENIRKQNERLIKKDERLKNLENGCNQLVKSISLTLVKGDKLLNKCDESASNDEETIKISSNEVAQNSVVNENQCYTRSLTSDESDKDKIKSQEKKSLETPTENISTNVDSSTSGDIDHEARFAARDIRLKSLEEQTKSLVRKVIRTNTKGVKINYKLQELHNIYGSDSSRAGTPDETDEKSQGCEESSDEE